MDNTPRKASIGDVTWVDFIHSQSSLHNGPTVIYEKPFRRVKKEKESLLSAVT